MTRNDISAWVKAAEIDDTLRMKSADWSRLDRIAVRPQRYSLAKLHKQMERSEPILFRDCPVALKDRKRLDPDKALLELLAAGFPKEERARVKIGPDARIKYLDVQTVIERWRSGKSVMNISDLHFRDTKFAEGIELAALTNGNILCMGNEDIAAQEMLTLVISTSGAMSDSHSDDPDGNNHCFIGKKLWLAWDTFEGKSKGLQDVSRDTSETRAKFSMSKFLSLESACWFTVERNQTLFLPGRMTHKVLTLENYIGIGCFYVTIPNCLRTLMRWNKYGPLWSLNSRKNDSLVDEVTRTAAREVRKLKLAPAQTQDEWGLDHLARAARKFEREIPAGERRSLLKNQAFAELIHAIGLN
jgi:hypothetical protein